jgi:hypothetical protein
MMRLVPAAWNTAVQEGDAPPSPVRTGKNVGAAYTDGTKNSFRFSVEMGASSCLYFNVYLLTVKYPRKEPHQQDKANGIYE